MTNIFLKDLGLPESSLFGGKYEMHSLDRPFYYPRFSFPNYEGLKLEENFYLYGIKIEKSVWEEKRIAFKKIESLKNCISDG